MAANTRTKSVGFAFNDTVTATEFNKLDTNGAQSINRNSSGSGNRRMPLTPAEMIDQAGGGLGTRMGYCIQGTIVTFNVAYYIWLPLHNLPHGQVLSSVALTVLPAGAHGAQPAVLPSIDVYRIDGSGSAVLLGTGTHTWTGIPGYEAGFDLTASGIAHTISNSLYTYWVRLTLESGVNSVTGLTARALYANCTIDHAYGGTDLTFWV